jgi:hypothetical protein
LELNNLTDTKGKEEENLVISSNESYLCTYNDRICTYIKNSISNREGEPKRTTRKGKNVSINKTLTLTRDIGDVKFS